MQSQTLYSPELRNYLHSLPWPKGFDMEVRESEDALTLVLFDDVFFKFTGEDQKYIAGLLQAFLTKVRDDGVPVQLVRQPRE